MSNTVIDIDVRQALLDVGRLKSDMVALRAEMERTRQAGKDVFSTAALDAVKIHDEIVSIRGEYKKLNEAAATLKQALQNAADPVAAKKYAAALADVEIALSEIERTVQPLGIKLQDTFDDSRADAKKYADEIDKIQTEYNQLAAANVKLKASLSGTIDPKTATQYKNAIASAEKSLRDLEVRGKSVGADLPKGFAEFNKQASVGKEVVSELFGSFTKVTLVAEGVKLLANFAGEAVRVAEGYKKTEIAFQSLLGTSGNAGAVISTLNQFAAANGLVEESVQQAGKSLLAFGTPLGSLTTELKQIADLSAGTGKDFNELTTIFGKARVAGVLMADDINQLVDAGIPIIGEFAKILGVSESQVKKLGSEGKISFAVLQQAFENLTTGAGKFADLAQKQAEVTGSAARAAAQWSALLREVGALLIPIKNTFLDIFSSIAGGVNKLINPTKAANEEYQKQLSVVTNLDAKLPGLLTKYTTLSSKSTLTKTEQAELNKTLNDLGTIVPTAVENVDNYGNVLSINVDKIKAFSDGQKELLKALTENQLAIAREELNKLTGSYERLKNIAEGNPVEIDIVKFGGVTEKATTVLGGQLEARKKLLEAQGKELELTNKISEAQRVLASLEAGRAVAQTTAPTAPTLPTATVDADAIAKAAAARKKAAEDEAALLKEQAQLRADLLKDGIEKDKALEEIRYNELVASLEKSFKNGEELDKLKEDAGKGHTEKLLAIDTEYETKSLLKEVEALRAKEEARKAGFDNEVAQAQAAAAILDGIQKQRAERLIQYEKDLRAITEGGATIDQQKALLEKLNKDLADIDRAAADERKKLRLDSLQEQQDTELAEFDALQSELLTQYKSVRGRTEAEVQDFEQALGDSRRLFQLEQQKKLIEAQLQFADQLGEAQKQQLAAQLKDVTAQIKGLQTAATSGGGKGFSIFDFIGANTDEEKDAIKQAASEIIGSIESITDARVEAARKERELAEQRVAKAKEDLQTEIDLAELGFASYVDLRRQDLESANAAQSAAEAQQRRAARAQLAIDAAQQVSSIVTASARIFAEGAKFFPVGLALSIAGIASLLATIASVRARARAIASNQFRHGGEGYVDQKGIVRGPSHEGGGVKVVEVEGDEFFTSDGKRFAVVNRKMTAKHFDLLQAVNNDDRAGMRRALAAITDAPRMRSDVSAAIPSGSAHSTSGGGANGGITKQEYANLMQLLYDWKSEQRGNKSKPKRQYIYGKIVETFGNTTREINK